ncbi:hypothetical protein C8Q76DRAFT_802296 [Earliella scabrosa]|nr:hypothetical protein C8Q76DRAFT_802296 [Earliella scabrosa]
MLAMIIVSDYVGALMWLLSTDRAELKSFVSPEDVPGGYAILSHVWGENEQSFQDTQALYAVCAVIDENPRDRSSEKIKMSCELAQRYGYAWLWNDTCCIDKTSSADLSEAINSMFRYYSLAGICFAYLRDVPTDYDASCFMSSTWHQRGWTLQELIAPTVVLFLSQSWEILGSKADFSSLLQDATGVPATLLRSEEEPRDFSIAQRMSWAARRRTTRVEDEAYCLLGIFDINMPTLYGEGRKAFRRLQEEIMKQFPDTTLFAWGRCCEFDRLTPWHELGQGDACLFAPAPSAFVDCEDIRYTPRPLPRRWNAARTVVSFAVTPHGVLAKIPVVKDSSGHYGDLGWSKGGRRLLLLLWPLSSNCRGTSSPSAHTQAYCVGRDCLIRVRPDIAFSRVVYAPHRGTPRHGRLDINRWRPLASLPRWTKIYFATQLDPPARLPPGKSLLPFNLSFHAPFHFAHALMCSTRPWDLAAHGHRESGFRMTLVRVASPAFPWTGSPPAAFVFQTEASLSGHDYFVLHLGVCTALPPPPPQSRFAPGGPARESPHRGCHWARLEYFHSHSAHELEGADVLHLPMGGAGRHGHACATDHILDWPDMTRVFAFERRGRRLPFRRRVFEFTLSFVRSVRDPLRTLVVHAMWRTVRWDRGARVGDGFDCS